MDIPKLWSDNWDYNESVKDFPDWWKHRSRRNEYIFLNKDGTRRNLSDIIIQYDAKSILDYGCGKSPSVDVVLRDNNINDVIVAKYDPFVEGVDIRPEGQYDIVVCHNVLGGVERQYVDAIIQDLLNYSTKVVVIKIPSRKKNIKFFFNAIKKAKGKVIKEFSIFETNTAKQYIPNFKTLGEVYMYFLLEKQNEEYGS